MSDLTGATPPNQTIAPQDTITPEMRKDLLEGRQGAERINWFGDEVALKWVNTWGTCPGYIALDIDKKYLAQGETNGAAIVWEKPSLSKVVPVPIGTDGKA